MCLIECLLAAIFFPIQLQIAVEVTLLSLSVSKLKSNQSRVWKSYTEINILKENYFLFCIMGWDSTKTEERENLENMKTVTMIMTSSPNLILLVPFYTTHSK